MKLLEILKKIDPWNKIAEEMVGGGGREANKKKNKCIFKAGLLAFTLFNVIFTSELLFRAYILPSTLNLYTTITEPRAYKVSENEEQVYEFVPNLGGVLEQGVLHFTNSLGFRDKERSINKEKEVFRIGCLGDSLTYGFCLPYEGSYPAKLEQNLNSSGTGKYEVWNMGIIGYTTMQEVALLENLIKQKNPSFDVAILGFYANDIKETPQLTTYFRIKKLKTKIGLSSFGLLWEMAKYKFSEQDANNPVTIQKMYSGQPYNQVKDALYSFYRLGRNYDFKSVVLLLPSLLDMRRDHSYYKEAYAKIKKDSARIGLDVIDAHIFFKDNTPSSLCADHLDVKENELVAEKLAEYIKASFGEVK